MKTDNDNDLERRLRSVLRQELDREHGPDPAWDESPAARRVAEQDRRRPSRWTVRILAIAALITIGVGSAFLLGVPDDVPALGPNGWIAYGMNPETGGDQDIWFVSLEGEPRRVIGTDTDVVDQFCPAFSPDGRNIAYGEADQSGATPNTAVVIASVNSEGAVSEEFRVDVGEVPPCPVWSPDGDRIAFGVPLTSVINPERGAEGSEVWIVTVADRAITVLPDLLATDLEFSPDGSLLAVASGSELVEPYVIGDPRIHLYELASGATRTLESTLGAMSFTWSPDGGRIAYMTGDFDHELILIDLATEEQRAISTPFTALHGIGPVWSPDGESIVYQRRVGSGEAHNIVQVWPDDLSVEGTPRAEVIPLIDPSVDADALEQSWSPSVKPYWVTWSPDGAYLVYAAWTPQIDPLLGVVPAAPGSPSDFLVTDQDLAVNPVYGAGPFVPIQTWQRRPAGAAVPSAAEPTPSPLAVGASHVLLEGTDSGVPVTVNIAAPLWSGEPNGGVLCWRDPAADCAGPPDGAGIFVFASREYDVYSDACDWGNPVTSATTVDDFVGAMTGRSQQHRWGLPPEDITVDGYAGKRILVLMAQTIYWGSECTDGVWALFGVPGDDLVRSSQGKDQIEEVWALDVDGLIVVLVGAHYPDTPQHAVDELRAIVQSATFD
jgi:Tol biopolymer transport system component